MNACIQRYVNLYSGIAFAGRVPTQTIVECADASTLSQKAQEWADAKHRRILHVIPDLGIGGAERMLAEVAIDMNRRPEFETVVVTLLPGGFYINEIRAAGTKVAILDCNSTVRLLVNALRLVGLIRRLQPAIVQGWLY